MRVYALWVRKKSCRGGRRRVSTCRTRSRHPCSLFICSRQMTVLQVDTRHLPERLTCAHSPYVARFWQPAFPGGIGDLLAGQSGCREQPISAQGRLERVLQAGPRFIPLAAYFVHMARSCKTGQALP